MNKIFLVALAFLFIALISCSKKVHPSASPSVTPISGVSPNSTTSGTEEKKVDSETTVVTKTVVKKAPETSFPKVITVNDSAAHKSVDGRMYYDVLGHRYWRNNKDGKYYLFDKSMYNNKDFLPVK